MNRWATAYIMAGAVVIAGYLWVESRGMVFGSTDTKAALYASDDDDGVFVIGRPSGWGLSGGHFGGK